MKTPPFAEILASALNAFPRVVLLAAVAVSGAAVADKSDRDKPVNIEADRVTIDDDAGTIVWPNGADVSRNSQDLWTGSSVDHGAAS